MIDAKDARHRRRRRRLDRPRQGPGDGKSETYTIVGSAEANPAEHKLSNESPVGKALIGHKRNEIVTVRCRTARSAS